MHYVTWSGQEIRHLREHAGMSQSQFARAIGTTKARVSEWETNKRTASPAYLRFLTAFANESGFWPDISGNPQTRYQLTTPQLLRVSEPR